MMKRIVNKSGSAELAALSLSLRERMRPSINIDRLRSLLVRQGQKVVQSDYLQYWKDIEAEGLGYLSLGRMGNASRFYFACDPRKIGKAGVEGSNEHAAYIVKKKGREVIRNFRGQRTHNVLRAEVGSFKPFKLSIEIPDNLSEVELKNLFNALKRTKAISH